MSCGSDASFNLRHGVILAGILVFGFAFGLIYLSHTTPYPTRTPAGDRAFSKADLQAYPQEVMQLDHWSYLAMATAPFSDKELVRFSPHCWRVLTPWLVHFSRIRPEETGFLIITYASVVLGAVFFALYLLQLHDPETALWGAAFYFVLPVTAIDRFIDPMYMEPLALCIFSAGLYFIETGKRLPLFFLILIGLFQREQILLLGIVLIVRDMNLGTRIGAPLIRRGLLFIGLPYAASTLLKFAITPVSGYPFAVLVDESFDILMGMLFSSGSFLAPFRLIELLLKPWGLIGFFLILFGWREAQRYYRKRPQDLFIVVPLYAMGIIICVSDLQRYVCYAAPIIFSVFFTAMGKCFSDKTYHRVVLGLTLFCQAVWTSKLVMEEMRFVWTRVPVIIGFWVIMVTACYFMQHKFRKIG